MSQSELARMTGIAQSAISAFECGAQEMGLKRVKVLGDAPGVHPAVIAFPDYVAPVASRGTKTKPRSLATAPAARRRAKAPKPRSRTA